MTCQLNCGTGIKIGLISKCLKDIHIMWCKLSSTRRIIILLLVLHWIELWRYRLWLILINCLEHTCKHVIYLQVWQLGSHTANFTLEGHEKGVNCVDYYHAGDKPYLISGADDRLVKIWDYQNKTCVQTLEGHAQNISSVAFHPELPILLTGSEDGTVK